MTTHKIRRRRRGKRILTDADSTNLPPARVRSEGITLAPTASEWVSGEGGVPESSPPAGKDKPQKSSREEQSQKSKSQSGTEPQDSSAPDQISLPLNQEDDDFSAEDWGGDYDLPQRD